MKKLTPISFSVEESQQIQTQLGVQEAQTGTPRSTDPVNYPLFGIPVGKKVLIYVPNHTVQDENGIDRLRMDKPLVHSVMVGRRYMNYRCINGLVSEAHGLNGTCPLCDGVSEPWELANKKIEQKCETQGLDPQDTENKDVKSIRSAEFSERVLKEANRHFTFPIVVFETENDDGKTLVKGEDGQLKCKVYWYDCSETTWDDKWMKALESIEDEPSHPGGNFFLLNYVYKTKNNQPQNARDAARNLSISHRKINNSEKLREFLDRQTEGWTPAKAQETLYSNMIYSEADLQSVTDEALENTRNLIALYDAGKAAAPAVGGYTLSKPSDSSSDDDDTAEDAMGIETDLEME